MKFIKTKLQAKLSFSMVIIVILIQLVSLAFYYFKTKEEFNTNIKFRLNEIVNIASLSIDTETHSKIINHKDENNNDYKLIQKQLQNIQKSIPNIYYIYTLRYDKTGKIKFIVDADNNSETIAHLGDTYNDASIFLKKNISKITKPIVANKFHTDKWGRFLSGYAPLYNSNGEIDAILAIDIKAETIESYHKEILFNVLIFLLISSLFIFFIVWWYVKRFTEPIIKLTNHAKEIAAGNINKTISIKSNDEIGVLAETINTMNITIQDFVDNIKTETKHSLEESENRFKSLSEATFEAIFISEKGICIEANKAASKMFGFTYNELIGMFGADVIADESKEIVKQNMLSGYEKSYDVIALRKDGTKFNAEINGRMFKYQDKNVRITAIRDITERKKAEFQFKKLSTAVEQSANVIVITDIKGNIEYTNPKFTQLTGYTAKEAIGKNTSILNANVLPKEYYAEMWQVIISGKTWKGEFCNKTKAGVLFWENVTITPIKNDNNKIINFLAIKEDITELKKSTQKLKSSESKFRGLFTGMSSGVIFCKAIYNKQGNMVDCIYKDMNKKYASFTSLVREEAIGKKVSEMLPGTEPEWFSAFEGVVKTGNSISFEMYHEQSKKYYSVFAYSSDKDEFAAIIDDITTRKKAEIELIDSENRFKALSEATFEAVLFIDNGVLIDANKSAMKMSGYTLKEAIGMPIVNLIAPEYRKLVYGKMISGYNNPYDSVVLKKDGSKIDIEIHGRQVNYKGKQIRIVAIRDITERKENEKRLKELNATKDKFFSIIAHDLKSPFNTMIGFADILIDNFKHLDDKTKKEYINYIREGAENTYKLLENLLLWSRTQNGSISYNPENLNLYLLITETCKPLNQSANNKSIVLNNKVDKNLYINVDKNMFSTIIRNLISNAIKFTPKGGNIEIGCTIETYGRTSQQGNNPSVMEIYVKDTGVGIAKEKQNKIFDISENTSTKGTEKEIGTGLGLILCKEFVEKHGGNIWVKSEVEKGSEFIFTIPITT